MCSGIWCGGRSGTSGAASGPPLSLHPTLRARSSLRPRAAQCVFRGYLLSECSHWQVIEARHAHLASPTHEDWPTPPYKRELAQTAPSRGGLRREWMTGQSLSPWRERRISPDTNAARRLPRVLERGRPGAADLRASRDVYERTATVTRSNPATRTASREHGMRLSGMSPDHLLPDTPPDARSTRTDPVHRRAVFIPPPHPAVKSRPFRAKIRWFATLLVGAGCAVARADGVNACLTGPHPHSLSGLASRLGPAAGITPCDPTG